MISLDCETTGVDLHHGAKPFLVTLCNEKGINTWFEWDVCPLTREPKVSKKDIKEIKRYIRNKILVFQNPKFDIKALTTVSDIKIRWSRLYDTLTAGHLLCSNQPHDLTSMVLIYLGINLQPYEDDIKQACREAKTIVNKEFPDWRLASKNLPEMPSAKEKVWKFDMWLPRAVAKALKYKEDHPWWTVCSTYANADPFCTLKLFGVFEKMLKEKGLWKIYLERLKVLPIVYSMQHNGVTINTSRLKSLSKEYTKVTEQCKKDCIKLSGGTLDKLPINGVSNALRVTVFDHFGLESNKKTEKGQPSMDKDVLQFWLGNLSESSKAHKFLTSLGAYRKRATALSSMASYTKFGVGKGVWRTLHPSLNPTGTHTLRFSSSNPNEQNISKKEGFNLRYCFGPKPGRMWASLDYNNIELRISAYECQEPAMLELFENPNDPPFYGSYHLLIFSILHPKMFKKHGVKVKDVYESTWYQWVKNGNFAELYGAVESSGTADRAFHVKGAQKIVADKLTKKSALNQQWINYANKHGYVETMPDRTTGERGYPIWCGISKWGRIKPTLPFNYHVQGTACWVMMRAMVKVQQYLKREKLDDWCITMQIHDELVLDFPTNCDYKPYLRGVQVVMESLGDDIGVLLTCGCELNKSNWSEGVEL